MVSRSIERSCRGHQKFFRELEGDLCEAVRIYVRYDLPDENGEHRRERNERHNMPVPETTIPDHGVYLWDWFWQCSDGLKRIDEGVCAPIPWSEFFHWAQVTQTIVHANEYAILRAMDAAFCEETNVELQAYQERLRAERDRAWKETQGG